MYKISNNVILWKWDPQQNFYFVFSLVGLFFKQINPHETILKAEAIELFTVENNAPSAYIFSMANWLKVNILQRSVFNYTISLHSDNNYDLYKFMYLIPWPSLPPFILMFWNWHGFPIYWLIKCYKAQCFVFLRESI